jgi:GTP-binding protein
MQVTFIKSLTNLNDLPKSDKPHIAFIGRSNVGKSSLINHLARQKNLARVSSESGRTQTINLFDVDHHYFLVDLPGYGFANVSKEKQQGFSRLIHEYLFDTKQLKLIFLIIDARIGPTELDHNMMDLLAGFETPVVMILNKADKLKRSEIAQLTKTIQSEYPGLQMIPHSSLSALGRGEILQMIKQQH